MPTASVENYLKAIYKLSRRRDLRVKTKEIADELQISLPSVTSMVKSLAQDGLLDYERYKGVTLTSRGEQSALCVIRKHRLVELFLVETLDYDWDEVHQEAERLEHAISNDLAARIDAFLSYPRFDPHGDPIPTADGQIHHSDAIPLDQVEVGARVSVERVLDQDPRVLRYLKRINWVPGCQGRVDEILPFDGQVFVALTSQDRVSLSAALASRILVHVTN